MAAGTALLTSGGVAWAREALGVFGGWGAFRDERPARCFAIAEPARRFRDVEQSPFAAIGYWPGTRTRGQLHIRLRKARRDEAPATLLVGDRRFGLVGRGANLWAPDARADAAIVAAMRSATSMSIATRADSNGRAFVDSYALRGAATAIDAAALACARG